MMDQQRIFSASDLAQFEYCPRAWWYDEFHLLAQADQAELTGRLQALEEEFPDAAQEQPQYQMIERLLERARQFAPPGNQKTVVQPVPRIFAALVLAVAVLTIALIGLGLLLWLR